MRWGTEMGAGAHNFHFLRQGFPWTSGEQQLRTAQKFKSHLAKVGDRSEQPPWETLRWGHHRPEDR